MNRTSFIDLLKKYLNNSCSKEEASFLEEWYMSFSDKEDFTDQISEEKKDEIENRILENIRNKANLKEETGHRSYLSSRKSQNIPIGRYLVGALSIAASIIFGIYFFYAQQDASLQYSTGYGEKKEIFLPDSSRVILNANSSLNIASINQFEKERIVKIRGEAFFDVNKTPNQTKFIVKTGNLNVEVLGTRFNVNTRRKKSQVILEEGNVKLNIETPSIKKDEYDMQPGEMVEYDANSQKVSKKLVEVKNYISWIDNEFVFDDTPLTKIGDLIKNHYGYEVIIKDSVLRNKKFHGNSPTDSLEILLDKLTKIYSINITKKDDKLIFEKIN